MPPRPPIPPKKAPLPAVAPLAVPSSMLAVEKEVGVRRVRNGFVLYDSEPANMCRQPVAVAETPERLAELLTAWGRGR